MAEARVSVATPVFVYIDKAWSVERGAWAVGSRGLRI
jgi:hypothetical protein